jgi:8-oxo-dGTP pyrophosphatase MutT (NUDIX family)
MSWRNETVSPSRNRSGTPRARVLIVNPTYKPGWDLPGGMVEANESPLAAARRELVEELGLQLPSCTLLCIDWVPPHGPWDDQLAFSFDGGQLLDTERDRLAVRDDERSEFRFVRAEELGDLLRPRLWRRVGVALDVFATWGKSSRLPPGRPAGDMNAAGRHRYRGPLHHGRLTPKPRVA